VELSPSHTSNGRGLQERNQSGVLNVDEAEAFQLCLPLTKKKELPVMEIGQVDQIGIYRL
jgi:hypothetical protein